LWGFTDGGFTSIRDSGERLWLRNFLYFCHPKITPYTHQKSLKETETIADIVTNIITMKLKKRKIKYSAIFFLCWFALLVFLVDGVLKFQTLVDYFGSYALVEIALLLLVFLPTLAVYIFTKE